MPRFRRHRLTYADVMSSIAVFVALGGASYAAVKLPPNSVGTKQIKKAAVTRPKIDPKLLTSLKGTTGAPGPTGAQGATGTQGPKGDPGSGVTGVEKVDAQSTYDAATGFKSAIATCPPGKKAIGGGGRVEGVNPPYLRESGPSADLTQWIARGYSSGGGAWQVTASAICAA
jgi:hypothetical protein